MDRKIRHLHIILPIEYIVINTIHINNALLRTSEMQGKTHQVPILLAGLALFYIAGFSSAKYNLVGRDDEIATMEVTVDKGM